MAQERIELRFSPGNPNERALIDALNALGDEYGAKGRFLKERLLKGYTAILHELDGFMQEGDPMAALDRFAPSVDSKHYRVLKVLLTSRMGGQTVIPATHVAAPAAAVPPSAARSIEPAAEVAAPAAPVAAEPPEAVTVAPVNVAVAAPAPVPVQSAEPEPAHDVAGEEVRPLDQVSATPQESATAAAPAAADVEAEAPAAPPPRKHDWSAFAGIAGVKNKGG